MVYEKLKTNSPSKRRPHSVWQRIQLVKLIKITNSFPRTSRKEKLLLAYKENKLK